MKNFITFNTFVIVSFFVSIFPRKVALFLGRSAGSLLYIFLPIRKKVVKKNLQIAFPNLNNQEFSCFYLLNSDTLDNVVRCPYLIVEFIVVCHKSKFTEKYKGCQIKVVRVRG